MQNLWENYSSNDIFDELIDKEKPRSAGKILFDRLAAMSSDELEKIKAAVDLSIKEMGITFTVYNDEGNFMDRSWPLDIIPRILEHKEWMYIEAGLKQRVKALNMFINDVYNDQHIIKEKIFPAQLLEKSKNFLKQCQGITPAHGVWANICGSDLVRNSDGQMYVLEDNLRVPSGVSYMLENRSVIKRVFPNVFQDYNVLPVSEYPSQLYDMLTSLAPDDIETPEVVVLTPGTYNSAYFEHAYLAQQMGCELVEGRDLIVDDDDCVYMQTIRGLKKVDVIYRRIDDHFMDPEAFRPDSMLGVKGLMRAWKANNVALANAPGSGVADDKVVYAYVPDMIRYYLNEDIKLPNVPTYLCHKADDLAYVMEHIAELVVKPANESGGYGMLIGPRATKDEIATFKRLINEQPRNYIAQPTLALSTVPTLIDDHLEPRHVDLRPFILSGKDIDVTTGGLTRVAMVKGSLVVNSSQGGGSKDTWIVQEDS